MGTRITYRSKGHNRDGDNRINIKHVPTATKQEEREILDKAFTDPKMAFMKVTSHEVYAINKLTFNQKNFLFLEANPVTFYFSLAYDVVRQLDEAKRQLDEVLKAEYMGQSNSNSKAVVFSYLFKVSSVGIIFSFLAIEAFLNQQIPEHATIQYNGKVYSHEDAQRRIGFVDKLTKVVPALDGHNFCELNKNKAEVILNLKKLRDELTHLKKKRGDGMSVYQSIFQDILDFNLKKTVNTVKSFINFYHPKLIQNFKGKTQF